LSSFELRSPAPTAGAKTHLTSYVARLTHPIKGSIEVLYGPPALLAMNWRASSWQRQAQSLLQVDGNLPRLHLGVVEEQCVGRVEGREGSGQEREDEENAQARDRRAALVAHVEAPAGAVGLP